MSDGFRAVKETTRHMHGPRGVLACGYAPAEQEILLAMMENQGFRDTPAIFANEETAGIALAELLALPGATGRGRVSNLPRAVILSGLLEKELHAFMAAWKALGLPSQLWACLTPTSESWPLRALLTELERERQAFAQRDR